MDHVFIEDLRIETVIGIYDWERAIRQVVALDLQMAFDNRTPAATDRIEDTLNYKAVSKRLIAFVEASSFQLVETLAERCAEIVLNEFDVRWLRLKLSKPGAVRAPLSLFRHDLGVPKCAIGGITLANAAEVIAAGADLLAVISDLFDAPDIAARARAYAKLFA